MLRSRTEMENRWAAAGDREGLQRGTMGSAHLEREGEIRARGHHEWRPGTPQGSGTSQGSGTPRHGRFGALVAGLRRIGGSVDSSAAGAGGGESATGVPAGHGGAPGTPRRRLRMGMYFHVPARANALDPTGTGAADSGTSAVANGGEGGAGWVGGWGEGEGKVSRV